MNRFRKNKNQKGFTMIELMVVVVIVGILAAIAIPIYGKYIKNARMTEASGRMGEIITASKAYAIENDKWPVAPDSLGVVDLTSSENFKYEITDGAGEAKTEPFAVTATGLTAKVGGANTTLVLEVADITKNGVIKTDIGD